MLLNCHINVSLLVESVLGFRLQPTASFPIFGREFDRHIIY